MKYYTKASINGEISQREKQNFDIAYRAACESIVLLENDGATQRELVTKMGLRRGALKDVVRKAARNGYVTIEKADEKKLYAVKLTDEGRKLAEKREAAQDKAIGAIAETLSTEELAQLDAICEKLIVSCKDAGINGKKKGRKHHRKGHKHSRRMR